MRAGPSAGLMVAFVGLAGVAALSAMQACASSGHKHTKSGEPGPPPDAIACWFYSNVEHGITRKLLLRPGEPKSETFEGLGIVASYDEDGAALSVEAKRGPKTLFMANYRLQQPLPRFDPNAWSTGITGHLDIRHPSQPGCCQVTCGAVRAAEHLSQSERQAEARHHARVARRAALTKTALEREPCPEQSRLLTRDGPRCPPKHPLPERVAAVLAAHALEQRSFPAIDLEGAALDHADLRESDFAYARLGRASLRGAQLYFDLLGEASLDGADLERANLYAARLPGASLRDAKLGGAKLQSTALEHAVLDGADLHGAYLMNAELLDASLSRANLAGAFLIDARLDRAKLDGADLKGADLTGAILDDADLGSAQNLTQYQLDRACGNERTVLPPGLDVDRAPRPCAPGLEYVPCRKPPTQ